MTGNVARIRAIFHLSGEDLQLEEVSALLGVEPDEARRKGEPLGSGRTLAAETYWSKSVDRSANEIEAPVLEIIEILWPRRVSLAKLLTGADVKATLILWVDPLTGWPVLLLSEATIARLAALGLSLDMDLGELKEENE